MKVRVPMMIQDPTFGRFNNLKLTEGFDITREDFFLDGPVTRQVAVLDFDPDIGKLLPGVPFIPPPPGRKMGKYEIADEDKIHERDFIAVSVFATVLKTMYMFEEEDALGRRLSWAFDAPQLLVVPRAGRWENAYYERDSHSLQFFFFPNPNDTNETVYTSLSRDIVAHETGHAILDGIAPYLYNAITPQSLALHEAVADLTAVLSSFRSGKLSKTVLDKTSGSIQDSTAFNSIAEEFGMSRYPGGETGSLRSLFNSKTMEDVPGYEPHALSEVLSGALYTVMMKIHEKWKPKIAEKRRRSLFSASGEALAVGADQFKRMIFRALDYLPPGEVSYADYARAIIAADQASHPKARNDQEREWIRQEFVRRKMVVSKDALKVDTNFSHKAVKNIDLEALIKSDWSAYEFASGNRDLLCIPAGIPFKVAPRLDVTKRYYHEGGPQDVRECLFKVSWDQVEPNRVNPWLPKQRRITVGTTLAIDWETRQIRAILTSDHSKRPMEQKEQEEARDQMLQHIADQNLLQIERLTLGPDGKKLRNVISAEAVDGIMRVRRAAHMLHIIGEV